MNRIAWSFFVLATVSIVSGRASAVIEYKWCTTWNSQYTDSSGDSNHEDQYTSQATYPRTAEYSYFRLKGVVG